MNTDERKVDLTGVLAYDETRGGLSKRISPPRLVSPAEAITILGIMMSNREELDRGIREVIARIVDAGVLPVTVIPASPSDPQEPTL